MLLALEDLLEPPPDPPDPPLEPPDPPPEPPDPPLDPPEPPPEPPEPPEELVGLAPVTAAVAPRLLTAEAAVALTQSLLVPG